MRPAGGTSKSGRMHLDAELHTTVIELRLKWNSHQFVAVTNISFSICSRGEKVEFSALPRSSQCIRKANSTLLKSCAASAPLLQQRRWITGWLRPKNGRRSD